MNTKTIRSAILIFGGITAVIHLAIAFVFGGFDLIFFLNGLGFIVLIWAILSPPDFLKNQSSLVHWATILYTLVTIVLFFVFNAESGYGALGLLTKVDEVLLLIAVFLHQRTV